MRSICMVPILVLVLASSALAEESKKNCLNSVEGEGANVDLTAQKDQLDLTDNECETVTGRELRVKLFEIPQDDEKPMSLTVGAKNLGGILRFRIPFSF
jgi:hypothetical protein